MELKYIPFKLLLKEPFAIASGTRSHTPVMLVELTHQGVTGYGEASMPPYLGETTESVASFLSNLDLTQFRDPVSQFREILVYIGNAAPGNNAAKAAVDIAMHDLLGKITGRHCCEILNIPDSYHIPTSLTISIQPAADVLKKIKSAPAFTFYKIKLGSEYDDEVIEALKYMEKPFGVDVNQGWKDRDDAVKKIQILEEAGCLYVEQPMPKELLEEARYLKERTNIPLIADEAVKTAVDIENVKDHYDGINIKLMKSSGLAEGMIMVKRAKELGLKILLGSMVETSCGLTAAALLAPFADWVDLDSQFLTSNDPFNGVKVENGYIFLNTKNYGLGVEKAE